MEKDFERDTDKTFDMTFQCNMVARKNLITSCEALGHGEGRLYNPVHMVLVRPYRKNTFGFEQLTIRMIVPNWNGFREQQNNY